MVIVAQSGVLICHAKWCVDLSRKVVCWFVMQSCVDIAWCWGVSAGTLYAASVVCVWQTRVHSVCAASELKNQLVVLGRLARERQHSGSIVQSVQVKKLVIYYLPHWRISCSKNSGISDSFAWFENASLNLVVKQQGNGVGGVGGRGGRGRWGVKGGGGGGRGREKKMTNIMTVIWNHALGRLTTKGWKFLLLCYHKRILGDIYITWVYRK